MVYYSPALLNLGSIPVDDVAVGCNTARIGGLAKTVNMADNS